MRVITAYRPWIKNISGAQTTYCQNQSYLERTKDDRLSRQEILEDLCTEITQLREIGDHIFLIIELNENITSDTVT